MPEGQQRSPLAHLKESLPAARAMSIAAHLARLNLVEDLLGTSTDISAVTPNTVQIERVVGRLRAGGAEIDPAALAHVWPLQHARIIPNGTYFLGWPQDETVEAVVACPCSGPYRGSPPGFCHLAHIGVPCTRNPPIRGHAA